MPTGISSWGSCTCLVQTGDTRTAMHVCCCLAKTTARSSAASASTARRFPARRFAVPFGRRFGFGRPAGFGAGFFTAAGFFGNFRPE
jgi:hypothetical protein